MAEMTPMMKQYFEIKEQHPNCILFFRLGDFYEMFFDDAKTASQELELVLTGRDCGQEERAPMCGVPFHSCESYIARLVAKGYKVAICEQMEDPALAKGLVKRDVIRIITPGTIIEGSMPVSYTHLALIVEREAAQLYRLEIVNVVPQPKAGGSFATAAYESFTDPVAVEELQAVCGMDIGNTLSLIHISAAGQRIGRTGGAVENHEHYGGCCGKERGRFGTSGG